ncbi:mitochondrial carrier domain-containing protein [Bombardia bombarda]|uniref:Mitochondrial carrier domain-containing protein n=1 Tax=Bombardia bombarda TaxID=252184 RepID=A0AA39WAL9_9PEZI|nr:mitochondrial carrier domain-containing protein [Bombardia bombarda]
MSADFWAGYISGAIGIIIGNPLDVLKVRLQAGQTSPSLSTSPHPTLPPPTPTPTTTPTTIPRPSPTYTTLLRPWITGTAAPVLGYGALNALLFISYNRTEAALNKSGLFSASVSVSDNGAVGGTGSNLWTTWIAGAVGGLATWVVSTPTELVKCRAQLAIARPAHTTSSSSTTSSWQITKQILRAEGVRGLYFGGVVTALRDSVGYGFYFWSYELASRWVGAAGAAAAAANGGGGTNSNSGSSASSLLFLSPETTKVLLCGGLAGIVTWASIFPLDVIKTRVQAQIFHDGGGERARLMGEAETEAERRTRAGTTKRLGAWDIAKETYRQGGARVFFRGLAVCSVRAFIVNAVQWAVYEWIMVELGQGRKRGTENGNGNGVAGQMVAMG